MTACMQEPKVVRLVMLAAVAVALAPACAAPGDGEDLAGTAEVDTIASESPVSDPPADPPAPSPEDTPMSPPPAPPETIQIEGIPEEIDVRRVEAPSGFPVSFTTVAPADMGVEVAEAGDELRIEAEFAGVRRPEAHIAIVVLPPGMDEDAARAVAASVVDSIGGSPAERSDLPWAVATFTFRGDRSGFLGLGEHTERWFYIRAAYPPEFGDGMGPRIDLILRRWRWEDGTSLAGSGK